MKSASWVQKSHVCHCMWQEMKSSWWCQRKIHQNQQTLSDLMVMDWIAAEISEIRQSDPLCGVLIFVCISLCVLQTDYSYQYTECDSTGSRWRVAIPLHPNSCSDLPPPTRGTDCCKYCVSSCVFKSTVCDLKFPSSSLSFLLSGWEVFRDDHAAVHAVCSRLVFSGQRPPFWPMGCHPCRLHQHGQLLGPRAEWRGHSGL